MNKTLHTLLSLLLACTLAHAQPGEGLPNLPAPITSFGAAVEGDYLYVYGGHIGKAHAHSRDNLHNGFHRLNLASRRGASWENLPMGTKIQGFALVADNGFIYRVGGLTMYNASDEPDDTHSLDEFQRFDPTTGQWEALAPLPEPRSSHDATVLEGKLYVIGGWKLAGLEEEVWASRGYVADLKAEKIEWQPLPDQPFKHRALAVATAGGKVLAIGGMNENNKPTNEVHVFDPGSGQWSRGPDLPVGAPLSAFAVSAFGVDDSIWASAIDSRVYRLQIGRDQWEDTGHKLKTPRFFHRLVAHKGQQLLFLGGAGRGSHLDSVESVEITTLLAKNVEPTGVEPHEAGQFSASQKGSTTWPGFRGTGDSHTTARGLPLEWSEDKNIAWTTDLPGEGQSSPVVWNDKVFVTSLEGENQEKLHVLCFDLTSGREQWRREFAASQTVKASGFVSKAAPTPAVDSRGVYAFFESGDLIALDHEGKTLWQRSLVKEYGKIEGNHGLGGSPAQTEDSIILLVDHAGPSYLLSVDKATGQNRWKLDRKPRVSWSTPVVSGREIIVSSNGAVEAFDVAGGRQLWSHEGLTGNTVPSPSVDNDRVFIGSSDRDSCVALSRSHAASTDRIVWKAEKASSNFGSPLLAGPSAYFVNRTGVAFSLDAATGRERWTLRLPAGCWASPVAAGPLIYFFSTDGTTTVIRSDSDEPVVLAQSSLPTESKVYGVAAVDGAFIIRTGSKLIRVGLAHDGQAQAARTAAKP